MQSLNIKNVEAAFANSWSRHSSSKYKQTNPALGQCGVTALVAQDCLGGEILKTWVVKPDIVKLWHYYNLINGEPVDFTISQFDEPIRYDHQPSTREEAFQDTNEKQYNYLRTTVKRCLEKD